MLKNYTCIFLYYTDNERSRDEDYNEESGENAEIINTIY